MDAARALRTTRARAGHSLRELARRSGTSHATLAAYEAGRVVPRVDTLDRILRAAGHASDIEVSRRPDGTHDEKVAGRVRWEPFAGAELPFLACEDLAVFKAFFDRTKDWADLEAMRDAGALDVTVVVGVLTTLLGADDSRIARLATLA